MAEEINGQSLNVELIQSIATGAASDGWDVTQGSRSDAPVTAATINATPTTVASVVALLKGILTGQSSGGGGAATIASGADVTEGSTTDAPLTAAATTSASTISAALKGLFNLFLNGTAGVVLKAGSAIVGKFGIDQTTPGTTNGVVVNSGALTATVDGADPASPAVANQGTGSRGWLATIAALLRLGTATSANSASVVPATDLANLEPAGAKITAATMPAGGGGLTGWLSAIWYQLTQVLGVKAAAAAFADGAITTLGSTTDAPLAAAASTTGTSQASVLKGLFNLFFNGGAKLQQSIWFAEQNNVSVTASTQYTGTQRNASASGAGFQYSYYQVMITATVNGSAVLNTDCGAITQSYTAGSVLVIKAPAFGTKFSCSFTPANNGALIMFDGFTNA